MELAVQDGRGSPRLTSLRLLNLGSPAMPDAILVLNAGSSSIKFSLFETSDRSHPRLSRKGLLDEDEADPRLTVKDPAGRLLFERRHADLENADPGLLGEIIHWIEGQGAAL